MATDGLPLRHPVLIYRLHERLRPDVCWPLQQGPIRIQTCPPPPSGARQPSPSPRSSAETDYVVPALPAHTYTPPFLIRWESPVRFVDMSEGTTMTLDPSQEQHDRRSAGTLEILRMVPTLARFFGPQHSRSSQHLEWLGVWAPLPRANWRMASHARRWNKFSCPETGFVLFAQFTLKSSRSRIISHSNGA